MRSPKHIQIRMKFEGPVCQQAFLAACRNLSHNYGVIVERSYGCAYTTSSDTFSTTGSICAPGRKLRRALTWYGLKPKSLLRVTIRIDGSVRLGW